MLSMLHLVLILQVGPRSRISHFRTLCKLTRIWISRGPVALAWSDPILSSVPSPRARERRVMRSLTLHRGLCFSNKQTPCKEASRQHINFRWNPRRRPSTCLRSYRNYQTAFWTVLWAINKTIPLETKHGWSSSTLKINCDVPVVIKDL